MPPAVTNGEVTEEPEILALRALGWVLAEGERAKRLLAITGLEPEALRGALDDRATLAAVLGFLENHEPDLVACAEALGLRAERIGQARAVLEQ